MLFREILCQTPYNTRSNTGTTRIVACQNRFENDVFKTMTNTGCQKSGRKTYHFLTPCFRPCFEAFVWNMWFLMGIIAGFRRVSHRAHAVLYRFGTTMVSTTMVEMTTMTNLINVGNHYSCQYCNKPRNSLRCYRGYYGAVTGAVTGVPQWVHWVTWHEHVAKRCVHTSVHTQNRSCFGQFPYIWSMWTPKRVVFGLIEGFTLK